MPGELFRFREFELDRSAFELRRAGRSVHLERIPFELLCLLVERGGQLVPREEIITHIWGKDVFLDTEHAINTAVRKIRHALRDDPEAPRFVLTVPAKGYRFVASLERPEPAVVAADSAAEEHEKPVAIVPSHGKSRWKVLIPAIVFLVALAAMSFLHFHQAQALTEKDTIVLPDFANSTGDAVFDDTLKQALSVQLSQSPFLNILSDKKMSETLQMIGHPAEERVTEKTALEICQRTQSAAVLAGSIARLGSQYVIGLNAVNCRTGDFLAKQQVRTNSKEDVLKAVDQAATKLRGELGESLSSIQKFDTPIEQATTPSLEALQDFSLGRTTLDVKGDFAGAVPFFHRAINLDPNFAMAYAALSASYSDLGENDLAAKNIQKAYELRERVTDREKFYIEAGYYDDVTGELEKTHQVCELWERTYPRDFDPHFFAGNDYELLGRYEDGLAEAREAVRLDPGGGVTNAFLAFTYFTTGQLEQAQTTIREIQAKKLDSPPIHLLLYSLAFARNDADAMGREVAWAAGKPGVEDVMIANEAGTAAYHGQLSKARELSRRAIESAERAGENETAAGYKADAAFREALFGNPGRVGKWAEPALAGSSDRIVHFVAILAMAIARDSARAQALAADLGKRFPQDTIVKFDFLPTIHAQIALDRNNPSQAVEALLVAAPYELGMVGAGGFGTALNPVYVRGEAYLAAGRGNEAAAEFQKILDHRLIAGNGAIAPLARLGLGRAYALQGDTAEARAAHRDFLALWKDADPDIPILKAAKAEYANLK
jgi:DNA-binding winged helix-turn-helix (wHTH) protein/tetratricopeptide (TPR) repeat protein